MARGLVEVGAVPDLAVRGAAFVERHGFVGARVAPPDAPEFLGEGRPRPRREVRDGFDQWARLGQASCDQGARRGRARVDRGVVLSDGRLPRDAVGLGDALARAGARRQRQFRGATGAGARRQRQLRRARPGRWKGQRGPLCGRRGRRGLVDPFGARRGAQRRRERRARGLRRRQRELGVGTPQPREHVAQRALVDRGTGDRAPQGVKRDAHVEPAREGEHEARGARAVSQHQAPSRARRALRDEGRRGGIEGLAPAGLGLRGAARGAVDGRARDRAPGRRAVVLHLEPRRGLRGRRAGLGARAPHHGRLATAQAQALPEVLRAARGARARRRLTGRGLALHGASRITRMDLGETPRGRRA